MEKHALALLSFVLCVQGLGRPIKIHPNRCNYVLVRSVLVRILLIRKGGDISTVGVFINEAVTGTKLACPRHHWSLQPDQV